MKLMRSLLVFLLAIGVVLGIAAPALAADPTSTPTRVPLPPVQVIRGIVTGESSSTITVDTTVVTVNDKTKYVVPGVKNPNLGTILVGMRVIAQARPSDNNLVAGRVTVVPVLKHQAGKVTAFSYDDDTGGGITVQDKTGATFSFEILPGPFRIQPRDRDVKLGDQVTVILRSLRDGDAAVAIGVVIQIPVERFTGKVTAFSYDPATGGRITIVDKTGKEFTFKIDAGKFNAQPKGASVQVGNSVTVLVRQRVAIGAVILPEVLHVSDAVTAIDTTAGTITVGATVLKYNAKTVFSLKGVLQLQVGAQVNAAYVKQADGSFLARNIAMK